MYSYFSTNAKKRLCLCFMFIWPSVYAQHCQNLRTGLYFTSFREKYSENKSISFGLIRMCNFSSHICSNFKNRILELRPPSERSGPAVAAFAARRDARCRSQTGVSGCNFERLYMLSYDWYPQTVGTQIETILRTVLKGKGCGIDSSK